MNALPTRTNLDAPDAAGPDPGRRRALAAAGTLWLGFAAAGCQETSVTDRQLRFATLADGLAELDRILRLPAPAGHAGWSLSQTLVHCAQSIEFSMTGFPQAKTALFQHTVGRAALQVFQWRGRMSHDLSEPIPGAPAIDAGLDLAQAATRLRHAAATFAVWNGDLKPHFAYGALDKPAYEAAHAMHLANHFSVFGTQR